MLGSHLRRMLLFLGAATISLPARPYEIERLEVGSHDGTYQIGGVILIDASADAVASVLGDFEAHVRIAPFIVESHVLERPAAHTAVVRVATRTCVGPFCERLVQMQRVEIDPPAIRAVAIPGQSDVKFGLTEWRVEAHAGKARLRVDMTIQPRRTPPFFVPVSWVEEALKEQVRETAAGVEALARHVAEPRRIASSG